MRQGLERFATIYVPIVYQWTRCGGIAIQRCARRGPERLYLRGPALPGFQHDQPGQSLRAWLRTITRHAVIDWHRARGPPKSAPPRGSSSLGQTVLRRVTRGAARPLDERTLLVLQAADVLQSQVEPGTWEMFGNWRLKAARPSRKLLLPWPGSILAALTRLKPACWPAFAS